MARTSGIYYRLHYNIFFRTMSEQYFTPAFDEARETVEYFDRNVTKLPAIKSSLAQWQSEYNRSISEIPPNRGLVAESAFQLFDAMDNIITTLQAVVETDNVQVVSIAKAKQIRHAEAARESENLDAQALVARINELRPKYEQQVEPLTFQLLLKRQEALIHESTANSRVKLARLVGTLLLAAAFLLREIKDYYLEQSNARSVSVE